MEKPVVAGLLNMHPNFIIVLLICMHYVHVASKYIPLSYSHSRAKNLIF